MNNMNNNIYSTFLPVFSQEDERNTMKKMSSTILPRENTNADIGISIFSLPKENIEKLEKQTQEEKSESIQNKQDGNQ